MEPRPEGRGDSSPELPSLSSGDAIVFERLSIRLKVCRYQVLKVLIAPARSPSEGSSLTHVAPERSGYTIRAPCLGKTGGNPMNSKHSMPRA